MCPYYSKYNNNTGKYSILKGLELVLVIFRREERLLKFSGGSKMFLR